MKLPRQPHALLDLEEVLTAAERILAAPNSNAQRVSENEILTLASIARQYRQLGILAARHRTGRGPDPAHLDEHLRAAGFLPPIEPENPGKDPSHG